MTLASAVAESVRAILPLAAFTARELTSCVTYSKPDDLSDLQCPYLVGTVALSRLPPTVGVGSVNAKGVGKV